MKYCIVYNKRYENKYLYSADEIIIIYNDFSGASLLSFIEQHQEQRVIISVDHLPRDLKDFKEKGLKFSVLIPFDKELIQEVRKEEIPYLLKDFPRDIDSVFCQIDYCPTDIYITETLGFEVANFSDIIRERNIKVRMIGNVAQSSWKELEDLKKFFIRPEDADFYEQYIDTIELWGFNSVYYKAYAIDKEWKGNLNEIIIGFKKNVDNKNFLPQFAERRSRCGKRCLKGVKCNSCNLTSKLSSTLDKI